VSGAIGNSCQWSYPDDEEALAMPTRNVNLTDHYNNFIDASIATGRFSNASGAVRAGLHLLELEMLSNERSDDFVRP
jgi:antitoxin ParD1/3/4